MSDLRKSLKEEKAQLNERISALEGSIQTTEHEWKDPVQITLINCQVQTMRALSQILLERIARL